MPIFRAAVDAAEQAILRMHTQDFGGAEAPAVVGASPYMAELVRHISLCRRAPSLCRPPTYLLPQALQGETSVKRCALRGGDKVQMPSSDA